MELREEKEEILDDEFSDAEPYYHLPSECYDSSEPMDIPNVGNAEYFTFAPVRRHVHPTNPDTNGFISSRILPDGSNTIRFTTSLGLDFVVPEDQTVSGKMRMQSEEFQQEYDGLEEKPVVVASGNVGLTWKE